MTPSLVAVCDLDDEPSLIQNLRPLRAILDDASVTEVCINSPGEAYVERYSGWSITKLPDCDFKWCRALASLVAHYVKQRVSQTEPLLSGTLPSGERVQFVLPPVMPEGCVSITIRRPSSVLWTLAELASAKPVQTTLSDGQVLSLCLDVFRETRIVRPAPDDELGAMLKTRDLAGFLRRAIGRRMNVLLSGATGSGKTSIAKAMLLEIPSEDRLVTIEDARELVLENQANHAALVYPQGGQGQAKVTGSDLLAAAKRMRPDWIIYSEIRAGEEANGFLDAIGSGHSSVTSIHAGSAEGALMELALKVRRSEAGRGMALDEVIELARMNVDVVVHCERQKQGRRYVKEVWYDPSAKRRGI